MPQFNTSLDRFYKTTAHWDQWNKYRELINDENLNNVKSQVITRQFNGVKQLQEERKRLTEGDKLTLVDINKNVEKFKKSIKDAETNLEEAKKNPLNDLFFSYNALMVAYKTLIDTTSKGTSQLNPTILSEIKGKIDSAIPQLEELLTGLRKRVDELYISDDPDEAILLNEKTIIRYTVFLQDIVDNLKSGFYGKTIDISDRKRKMADEYFQRNQNNQIRALENEYDDVTYENRKRIYSDFDRRVRNGEKLRRSEGAINFDKTGEDNKDLEFYERESLSRNIKKKEVVDLVKEYLSYLDDELDTKNFISQLDNKTVKEIKSLVLENYPLETALNDYLFFVNDETIDGYGKKDLYNRTLNPVVSLQNELKKLYLKRNAYIKLSTNKNLDKIQYEKINHKIHEFQREILQKTDLLQGKSIYELNRILDKDKSVSTGETQKVAPKGFQFVVDPNTGQTVLKPVAPEGQKKKEDIQPMIMNAQQIIAEEYGVYMKNQQKTASDDELKVKQESSATAIIPLFKAIFKTRPDEVQALHAGILDPVWKKMLLDRMPEINLPQPFTPPPPAPPKPDDKPVEPPKPDDKPVEPAKDRNKLQADITAKLKEILPIYDDWDQSESSNLTTLYSQIANICNSVLDLLETGRKGGLNVKGEISLDAIGGNNVLNGIKTEIWDNYDKGTRWNEGKDVKVPSPFEFTQEIERLVKIMTGHNDEFEQMEDQKQRVTEKIIFDRIRPEADELIKYLMKGQKWFPRQVYLRFKMDFGKNINESKNSSMAIVNDAYAKLYNLIWNHADEGTMFTDVGSEGTKLPDLPNVSGAVFTSQIKSLVDALNGTIDNWNAFGDERPSSQQNTAVFYPVVLNDVNNLINKYIDRDRYEADGRFNRSFRNEMDNQLNSILQAEPFNKNLSKDLKQKILDHAKDKTPFTVGGNRRKKAMNIEKIRADEFSYVSFKGLKKPKEGLVRPDPRKAPFVLKNPKSRVNVKSEGSGLLTKSNISAKRQELLKKLGGGMVCEDESSSDSEKEGGGIKEDLMDFYTDPVVKKAHKKMNPVGKRILKETFEKLLEEYPDEMVEDKRLDFIKYYLVFSVIDEYSEYDDMDYMSGLVKEIDKVETNDKIEDEIKQFIDKEVEPKKPRVYDAEEESFGDIPKNKGRRARGQGKKKIGHKKKKPTFTEI